MKRKVSFFTIGVVWNTPVFLFLTVLFVCGVIAGGFTGLLGRETDTVSRLATHLVNAAQVAPGAQQVLSALGGTVGWIVLALLGGLLPPPSLFIGAVMAARGFSLAFTVASMVAQLGMRGLWLSLAATGAASIVTVPCLLIVAAAAYLAICDAPRGQKTGYFYALGRYRSALAACLALSVVAAVLRAVLAPLALRLLA